MGSRMISPKELVALIPNVVLLFKDLLKDSRVPRSSKVLLVGTVAYIVSPIDLLPDFVPFIGQVDDALLAALVLRHFVRSAGPDVIREHWRGDPASLDRLSRAAGVSLW
ncbi:MAG: DUF1232 domain-containing protein [Actinomycetota bacterium]|nr:DUF1232 domain-containing protein [Actinomycetota bacterium]